MQGWLSDNRDVNKANEFYRLCEKSNQAYITIKPARKFADVSLDMISTDTVLTPEASKKVFDLFDQYRTPRSKVIGNGFYFHITQVLVEEAEDLAEMLDAIASIPRSRKPSRRAALAVLSVG
ncbi:hypothetical protein [Aeoliella sp. SH292]|uniref:hypothetical protein n=1 Tax=Aeoliella sp. SH292 TaxID=3454464 RepID=UPI003F9CDA31